MSQCPICKKDHLGQTTEDQGEETLVLWEHKGSATLMTLSLLTLPFPEESSS